MYITAQIPVESLKVDEGSVMVIWECCSMTASQNQGSDKESSPILSSTDDDSDKSEPPPPPKSSRVRLRSTELASC